MINFKQIYESIILEAMSLKDIWEKYYKNDIKDFELFERLNSIDLTSSPDKKGKYLDWIIKRAYKINNNLLEDEDKITQDLELFDKNYRHINKQITQIKDQYELAKLVEEFRKKKESGEIDLSRSEIKAGAEKIFENSDWLIIHPKTLESAKYYGAGTRWCTAADNNNMFEYYNSKGPLYILINKKDSKEKYQFHFQEEQFMDAEDVPISDIAFNTHINGEILDKLIELAEKNKNLVVFIKSLPPTHAEKYYNIYKKECDIYNLSVELIKASRVGDIKLVKDLVSKGADIHFDNESSLESACTFGHLEIVKYLVELGANFKVDNYYGLKQATESGHIQIVKYLVSKGVDISIANSQLKYVAENGHIEMVKYLISNGADIHDSDDAALRYAVMQNKIDIVKYLVERGADVTIFSNMPLIQSSKYGYLELVKYLIEHGADLYTNNDEPLRTASREGHLDVVKYLVEQGADIHAYNNEPIKDAGNQDIRNYLQLVLDKEYKNNENT